MIPAFALAFGQLGDRRLLAILAQSLALTLLVFAGLGAATWWALGSILAARVDAAGVAALLAVVLAFAALWLGFRAVAIAIVGLFGDQVVAAVEARHYPAALAAARPVPIARAALMGLRSVLRLAGYNLLAAPLYAAALVSGIGFPLAFFAVNGWLLGRDLGDMVAARHLPPAALAGWRRANRWRRAGAGLATAGLFAVPVVNVLAPVIGAAAMTHLFHRTRA